MGIGRDILADLPSLLIIPIALLGVKRLQEQFPDEKPEDIPPLIPTNGNSVKSCPYGFHLENGVCVKSKGIGL